MFPTKLQIGALALLVASTLACSKAAAQLSAQPSSPSSPSSTQSFTKSSTQSSIQSSAHSPPQSSAQSFANRSTDDLRQEARGLARAYKHKEAEPLLEELVRREPKNARFHFVRAKGLIEQGRFQKALDELLEASLLEPQDYDARFEIAQVYVYQGRFKDAAMVLEQIKQRAGVVSRDGFRAQSGLNSIARFYELGDPYSKTYADPNDDMPFQRQDFPIKVAIWADPEMTEWKGPFRQAVIEAFTKWRDASGGWLRFEIVDEQRNAKIVCKLVGVMRGSKYEGGGEKLGETLGDYDRKNADVRGFSRVEIFWGPDSNPAHFKHVVLHEVGHSLGLGHSNNTLDVMYPFVHPPYVEYPSRRDSATIRALYGIK